MFRHRPAVLILVLAAAICWASGVAASVLTSPMATLATLTRQNNQTGSDGASIYTIDGSGFPSAIVNLAVDPSDTTTTVWYVKPSSQGGFPGPADPPETLYFDLGGPKTLAGVALWQASTTSWGHPDDVDVDYATSLGGGGGFNLSDLAATTWTTGFNAAPDPNSGVGQTLPFSSPVSARYVRLTMNHAADVQAGTGQWGLNEFAVLLVPTPGPLFSLDFDGDYGPPQDGSSSMGRSETNDAFTLSQTFDDVFSLGDSVTVDFAGNRAKLRSALSGTFASESNLLRDWFGSESGGDIEIDLTLPEGIYLLSTFHHDVIGGGSAELNITDALGMTDYGTVTETDGSSPTSIGTFSAYIRSDGLNPVELDFTNLSSQFGINGLTLELVPEPSTFTLSALGLLSLAFVGWWRRR